MPFSSVLHACANTSLCNSSLTDCKSTKSFLFSSGLSKKRFLCHLQDVGEMFTNSCQSLMQHTHQKTSFGELKFSRWRTLAERKPQKQQINKMRSIEEIAAAISTSFPLKLSSFVLRQGQRIGTPKAVASKARP